MHCLECRHDIENCTCFYHDAAVLRRYQEPTVETKLQTRVSELEEENAALCIKLEKASATIAALRAEREPTQQKQDVEFKDSLKKQCLHMFSAKTGKCCNCGMKKSEYRPR